MRSLTPFLGLLVLFLTACTATPPPSPLTAPAAPTTPVSQATPVPGLQPAIDAGLSFLNGQYNRELGLLQESPNIGARRYFITNDNALAAYVFEQTGQDDLAVDLYMVMARFGPLTNNFIEVAWGAVIPWPPKHFEDPGSLITTVGEDQILTIRHEGPSYFYDWSAYSNLACMAAVNEYNQGYTESARRLYEIQMSTFDGRGFADKAFYDRGDVYETLGVAWCVYAGALLKAPVHEAALAVLLEQQDPATGGFHTHYRAIESRLADPNVETTSLALLALLTLSGQHTLGQQTSLVPPVVTDDYEPVFQRAVAYLQTEYDEEIGLLRESPITAPDRYWLATDNQLAVYALSSVDHPLAATVAGKRAEFVDQAHGLIEALTGQSVAWPPHVETQVQVKGEVWNESRLSGAQFDDWQEYADLALYGALNAYNQGNQREARQRYAQALQMFDGTGFFDKAVLNEQGEIRYATYKLALAIFVAQRIGEAPSVEILKALLSKQATSGGFVTLYDQTGTPQGDTNTETTSYALLALVSLSK